MKKLRMLLMLIAAPVLISCASTQGPPVLPSRVYPPANLTTPCPYPSLLGNDTMGAMSEALIENTSALVDCRERHRLLAAWCGRGQ